MPGHHGRAFDMKETIKGGINEWYVYSPSDSIFLQVVHAIWKVDGYQMPKTACFLSRLDTNGLTNGWSFELWSSISMLENVLVKNGMLK